MEVQEGLKVKKRGQCLAHTEYSVQDNLSWLNKCLDSVSLLN